MQFKGRGYSNEFKKLIGDKGKIRYLLDCNAGPDDDFEQWTRMRFFVSKAINRKGSILDIGCANGFLLRCLQEWSDYKLEMYGIDRNRDLINQARKLFPEQTDNFISKDLFDLSKNNEKLTQYGIPARYDFIYWNVWGNLKFESENDINTVRYLLGIVSNGGRLILGFSDSYRNKKEIIRKLKNMDFEFSRFLENRYNALGGDILEVIIWINR
tara:strand:- start:145 stop:783 length:639 start_codon:yes stop_codon:yes gene_type:complete